MHRPMDGRRPGRWGLKARSSTGRAPTHAAREATCSAPGAYPAHVISCLRRLRREPSCARTGDAVRAPPPSQRPATSIPNRDSVRSRYQGEDERQHVPCPEARPDDPSQSIQHVAKGQHANRPVTASPHEGMTGTGRTPSPNQPESADLRTNHHSVGTHLHPCWDAPRERRRGRRICPLKMVLLVSA